MQKDIFILLRKILKIREGKSGTGFFPPYMMKQKSKWSTVSLILYYWGVAFWAVYRFLFKFFSSWSPSMLNITLPILHWGCSGFVAGNLQHPLSALTVVFLKKYHSNTYGGPCLLLWGSPTPPHPTIYVFELLQAIHTMGWKTKQPCSTVSENLKWTS